MMIKTKSELRQHYRQVRQALSPSEQTNHAKSLMHLLLSEALFQPGHQIAFYWPNDGEISTLPLLAHCLSQQIKCYLPCLDSEQKGLQFGLCDNVTPLFPNRYGIPEPVTQQFATLDQLDYLLVPLVSFDAGGNRLGMGGGFYDYTLNQATEKKPVLIGLAHACQAATTLPTEPWDFPLDAIVTEKRIVWFHKRVKKQQAS